MSGELLTIWCIYKHPKDYPGKWVVRAHDVGAGWTRPHHECYVASSLSEARKAVPPGFERFDAFEMDDPVIVETWL